MKYFWALFWSFLLSNMMVYVVANMTTTAEHPIEYSFNTALILTVIFTIFVGILGDGVLNKKITD